MTITKLRMPRSTFAIALVLPLLLASLGACRGAEEPAGEPAAVDTEAQAPQAEAANLAIAPAVEPAPTPDSFEAVPRPLVEILIPRSPEMARTEFFLGDAAQRVVIEEFDSPDLRRAPPMPRIHPREIPEPRNELQRLAALQRWLTG